MKTVVDSNSIYIANSELIVKLRQIKSIEVE